MTKLVLSLLGLAVSGSILPVHADAVNVTAGAITATAVLDTTTLDLKALDVRGQALLTDAGGTFLLTDAFAGPSFGNLDLVGLDLPADGNDLLESFQPASFVRNGLAADVNGIGSVLAGTLSPPEQGLLGTTQFHFVLNGAPSNTDFGIVLPLVMTGASPVPEPRSMGLLAVALAGFALMGKRRLVQIRRK